ncbi:MAG: class I SAM-dependent methyltransferase [Desulfobaccales bacterium]
MKLNQAERLLVNNPLRVMIQRLVVRWFGKTVSPGPGARLLEVGCGRGVGAALLLEQFQPAALHALDLDRRMIRQARASLQPEQQGRIFLGVADVLHLPYRDASLDGVFGFGVLHHLPDWRGGLAEIARILKPGGFYSLEEYYPSLYQNFLTRHLFRHPETDRFEGGDLRRGLKDAGFSLAACLEQRKSFILAVVVKDR